MDESKTCTVKYGTVSYKTVLLSLLLLTAPIGVTHQAIVHFLEMNKESGWLWQQMILLLSPAYLAIILIAFSYFGNKIEANNREIRFPLNLAPDLHFSLNRNWQDLLAVRIAAEDANEDGRLNDDSIIGVQKSLLFSFHSGGEVCIDLSRVKKKDIFYLFSALRQWAPSVVLSPELIDMQIELTPEEEVSKSMTQLWEDEMSRHFSSTNYIPLQQGERLHEGRLTVITHLASGGLSSVYLARFGAKNVALKESVIPTFVEEGTKAKAQELFAREARLLMKLDHESIAKVFDHFRENGRDYLVLEHIGGRTLRSIVKEDGPQPEKSIWLWTWQILEALHYLHHQDPIILHRDLTPDNIVINQEGKAFLIDFGAANEFIGTATGTLIGKQCYISPEQFRGKAVPSSDLYSLGGTLFYAVIGDDPEALSQSDIGIIKPESNHKLRNLILMLTDQDVGGRIKTCSEAMALIKEDNDSIVITDSNPEEISA